MGCDIHLHIEIEINGKWEHYSHPHVGRSYRLFAKMADVRNDGYGIEPISEPKGLPNDLSRITQISADKWSADAHSRSWLSSDEIMKLEEWIAENMEKEDLEHTILNCYLFDNSFACFKKYRKEYPKEIQDVRFVFWFDN